MAADDGQPTSESSGRLTPGAMVVRTVKFSYMMNICFSLMKAHFSLTNKVDFGSVISEICT